MGLVSNRGRTSLYSLHARCLTTLGALLLLSPPIAGKKPKPSSQPPADLPGHVNYLARQLYGVPLDESGALTSQIEKLVLDHMSEWIAAHPPGGPSATSPPPGVATVVPYDVKVRREVEAAFAEIHYPIYATAAIFDRPYGQSQLVGVGYTLGWSDYDRANVVALFEAAGGAVRQVGLTHFVPDADLHYAFIDPPAADAGQFWFMVYGTRLGKSHPRLSAVLYAFDGSDLKSLWQTRDVYDGRISFAGGEVKLNYMREDEFVHAATARMNPPRREAAYRVTANGLELEYDHQL
jgi:hypothetical protein